MTDPRRPLRVLVVEEQPLLRDLFTGLVDQQGDMRTVAEASSARTALESTERAVDVALIGPHLSDGGGVALGHALRGRWSCLGVVVLTTPGARDHVRGLAAAEAPGWAVLSQNLSLTAAGLVYAMRSVAVGRSVHDPAIRAQSDRWQRSPLCQLSVRQREVLALVADGLSNMAIARRLAISPRSVEAHLRASYAALGVGSDPGRNARVDAARHFLAHCAPDAAPVLSESPLI